mgnify:CR=1 FL=1
MLLLSGGMKRQRVTNMSIPKSNEQRFFIGEPQPLNDSDSNDEWLVKVYFEQEHETVRPLKFIPPRSKDKHRAAVSVLYDFIPTIGSLVLPGFFASITFYSKEPIELLNSDQAEPVRERINTCFPNGIDIYYLGNEGESEEQYEN